MGMCFTSFKGNPFVLLEWCNSRQKHLFILDLWIGLPICTFVKDMKPFMNSELRTHQFPLGIMGGKTPFFRFSSATCNLWVCRKLMVISEAIQLPSNLHRSGSNPSNFVIGSIDSPMTRCSSSAIKNLAGDRRG